MRRLLRRFAPRNDVKGETRNDGKGGIRNDGKKKAVNIRLLEKSLSFSKVSSL